MLSEILGLQIAPQRIFKFHPPLLEFYGRPFCTANVLSLKNSTYWLLLSECFEPVPNRSELPSQHWHCQLRKTLRRLEMAMAGFWIMGRDDYRVLWSLGPRKAGCGTTVLMFRYLWRTHNNIQSFSLRFRDAHSHVCIKNNHNKFVRFEFCRRLNYTSNKSRSDLIWSNSTIQFYDPSVCNHTSQLTQPLPPNCFFLLFSHRIRRRSHLSQYTIDLALSTIASSKSWSGCWDTFRYIIGVCQKKNDICRCHWTRSPDFVFKLQNLHIQNLLFCLNLRVWFWGKQIPAFWSLCTCSRSSKPPPRVLTLWPVSHETKDPPGRQSKARPSQATIE